MKLGLLVAGGGGLTVSEIVGLALEAEGAGFDGVFVPESWRSGVVAPTAIAAATERIAVGAYVLNAHARTPLSAGMDAVDLDQLSGGRVVLGIGSGNEVMNTSGHGVPVVRPLQKMREYVEVLRTVTQAAPGATVSYAGDRHPMTAWRAQAVPARPSIPILLAATSPRMMDLAADVADGVALGTLQSASYVADVAARLRSRSRLGDGFKVFCAPFVAVADDHETARAMARRAVVDLFAIKPHPHYERLIRLQGHGDVLDALLRRIAEGRAATADEEVSDEVVDALLIAGTPQECLEQMARYAGVVDMLLFSNVGAMGQLTQECRVDTQQVLASYQPLLILARLAKAAGEHAQGN